MRAHWTIVFLALHPRGPGQPTPTPSW
ncbi:unnamed protein product [Staurois parvus]|uniref:Uncharacterized protein n=1 Tax=Staurois parvus TaxID=386267 RepID=A0ABN9AFX2_9NEOB|nr:unnamed protein product [Staurois parvus]